MRKRFQQFKKPCTVFRSKSMVARKRDMESQYHKEIFGHKSQVISDESQLLVAQSTPISFTVAWIGIYDIIQHDEMNIALVECIICRPEMCLIRFVGKRISIHIKINVVVTHHVVPGYTDFFGRRNVGIKQVGTIPYQIA